MAILTTGKSAVKTRVTDNLSGTLYKGVSESMPSFRKHKYREKTCLINPLQYKDNYKLANTEVLDPSNAATLYFML